MTKQQSIASPPMLRFNAETMSGIFPGSRPLRTHQLFIVRESADLHPPKAMDVPQGRWAQLYWRTVSDEPLSTVQEVVLVSHQETEHAQNKHTQLSSKNTNSQTLQIFATLLLSDTGESHTGETSNPATQFLQRESTAIEKEDEEKEKEDEEKDRLLASKLATRLQAEGWQLQTCGTCAYWQSAERAGRCTWRKSSLPGANHLAALTTQSPLAATCPHWRLQQDGSTAQPALRDVAATPAVSTSGTPPTRRQRLVALITGRARGRSRREAQPWYADVLARLDGPGSISAGTEACIICAGRSVNLGTQNGKTDEGDTEAWSVWRCRRCQTYFASHWIDRWVRLESLETEERLVRLAPAEALSLLRDMASDTVRSAFGDIFTSRPLLVHEIKRGR